MTTETNVYFERTRYVIEQQAKRENASRQLLRELRGAMNWNQAIARCIERGVNPRR